MKSLQICTFIFFIYAATPAQVMLYFQKYVAAWIGLVLGAMLVFNTSYVNTYATVALLTCAIVNDIWQRQKCLFITMIVAYFTYYHTVMLYLNVTWFLMTLCTWHCSIKHSSVTKLDDDFLPEAFRVT